MTKSATRIQDKDTQKRLSIVKSKEDPTKFGIVILNPDGSRIRGGGGGGGDGDVVGPDSSTNGDIVLFDGTTGKLIKDSGASLSSYQTTANMVTDLNNPDNTHYPSALAVKNAITAGGNGDVSGPASSTDGDIVLFDGNTGKLIKDGSKSLSDLQDKLTTQTAYTSKGTSSKVPQITTNSLGQVTGITEVDISYPSQVDDTAYGASWDGVTNKAPSQNAVYDKIKSVDDLIPSAATSSNQLADKDYVNDGINSVTAYYITKNAAGDQFATYAELSTATTFYSGGVVRVPTKNDYTIVLADENHDNATTRYIYNNSWEYQYTVNETALTQAQLNAINSGITSGKVSTYDGYASGKQDTLSTQTAYSAKGTASKVPQITTNSLGQVTSITEVDISYPSQVSDTAYGASWDGETSTAPSKNAVYDKIESIKEVPSGGSNGDVLTNVSGTPTWQAPAASGIQNDTVGTTTTIAKERCGTEGEYSSKVKEAGVIYFTY